MQGRVFDIAMAANSMFMQLGMLVFGPLSDVVFIELLMIMTGMSMLLLTIWTTAYYAISAKDAFEKLNKLPFCLVIMDTHLSEMDGIDLLRTIRILKTIPVLVLSSKLKGADKVAALRAGASSYINSRMSWRNVSLMHNH